MFTSKPVDLMNTKSIDVLLNRKFVNSEIYDGFQIKETSTLLLSDGSFEIGIHFDYSLNSDGKHVYLLRSMLGGNRNCLPILDLFYCCFFSFRLYMKYLQAKIIQTVLIVEMGTVEEQPYFVENDVL